MYMYTCVHVTRVCVEGIGVELLTEDDQPNQNTSFQAQNIQTQVYPTG